VVDVLAQTNGWWRVGGFRVSFDLFFESLPLRGVPISPERAWHEVADVLEPLTLSILFWDAAIASWWLFARDHTQEEEMSACELNSQMLPPRSTTTKGYLGIPRRKPA